MKLSEYIKEIQHLIQVDGDIETERLIMDNENCHIVLNGVCYKFNEYKERYKCLKEKKH